MIYNEILKDYPNLLEGYEIKLDEFDYEINPRIYYELSIRLNDEDIRLIVKYIDELREKLTNYELIKGIYKLTQGRIKLSFEDMEQILYYFELPNTRQKYNKLYFPNIKRYVKYHDLRDFNSRKYQERKQQDV